MKQLTLAQAKKLLPSRGRNANKTHGGKTLVIAGSPGFFGAAILTATAAARTGSGYTYLMTGKKFPAGKYPDFLVRDFSFKDWDQVDAFAVGPGLGVNAQTEKILNQLRKGKFPNVVVDADALTVIAQKNIFPLPETWILTPHRGELQRLVGEKGSLEQAQAKYGCHILLKGPKTYVINSDQKIVVREGNAALAKAGTGDVLTGIIAGLLAQGLDSFSAASLGAFIHGRASKFWIDSGRDHLSLLASDLFEIIPVVMNRIRRGEYAVRAQGHTQISKHHKT